MGWAEGISGGEVREGGAHVSGGRWPRGGVRFLMRELNVAWSFITLYFFKTTINWDHTYLIKPIKELHLFICSS